MITYLGEEVTEDIVDNKTRKRRNKAKAWERGYNEEFDLVCISKDGTLGSIFSVNGLNIGLPEIPEDKSKIINHDKPKFEQKWKRQPLPEGLNAETENDDKYADYIIQQFERRDEGVYIYINGKPIYLTGTMHFFLNWIKLDEGFPDFRVIQNDLMIYWEACKADPRTYGMCYVKNRRFGWSSMCNAELTDAGTTTENSLCGIISKTGEDARNMFGRLVRAFKKLPSFFTPVWDGTSNPKKELNLTEPTTRRSKSTPKKKLDEEGLDTVIRFYATTLNSMDGERVYRSAIDEGGKFPKDVPFDDYWSVVKTSHRLGSRIVGKSMIGSTMNSREKGGAEYKKVYDGSDPLERNKNGQTTSGLYKLFIDAAFCIEGYFDEYGFSIVEDPEVPVRNEFGDMKSTGAITYLNNEGEALKKQDSKAYYEFLRQFPRSEEHAFRDEAGDCAFDVAKIYEGLEYNENELDPSDVQIGNFQWKGGVQDSEVEWIPNPKGRFRVTWHPPEENKNKYDWVTLHGIRAKHPKNNHLGSLACDPYNRSQTVDGRGSNGSIHGQTKSLFSEDVPSDFFFVEYIDRPRTVELFFEDAIMVMLYFSMPMLIELANEKFLTVLKDRGYRWFSMNRPDKKWKDLSPTEKEFGGIPAQGQKIGDAQFYAVEAFINDHLGVENRIEENMRNRPFGEIGRKMYFNRTVRQWKDVDPEKRTKYDAYISSSLVLIANQTRVSIKRTEERKPIRLPISTFNNSGSQSKRN